MFGRIFWVLAISAVAGIGAVPTPAQADEPLVFEAVSPWTAEYADESCMLRRQFASGDHSLQLELNAMKPPGRKLEIVAGSKTLRTQNTIPKFRWLPDGDARKMKNAFQLEANGGMRAITAETSLDAIDGEIGHEGEERIASIEEYEARDAAITGLEIADGFRDDLIINTGSLADPMKVMRHCLDGLLEAWGYDPFAFRSQLRRVAPKGMSSWAKNIQQEYPSSKLREGESSVMYFRLRVDEKGRVADCVVQKGFADKEWRRIGCQQLTRYARFEPALDSCGLPTESLYQTKVTYRAN